MIAKVFNCGVFLLEFAKHLCFDYDFTFLCQDMNFFRHQIKEELVLGEIIRSSMEAHSEEQLTSFPFIICYFQNPPKQNLCLSNVVTSLILNIPVLKKLLSQITLNYILEDKGLIKELHTLANLPKFSKSSTALRVN